MPRKAKKTDPVETEHEETILQPEISIGMVGHVDHGKTTLVKALSGKWTDTHSEEIKRGITIRLGYADAVFYHCLKCGEFSVHEKCKCGEKAEILRKVSFVDAPGHESLMATMLSGAAMMDGALLLVAANEHCPQPQTREHLMALKICGIKNVVIVQNKIDTVSEEECLKNYEEIKEFVKGTEYSESPIIPISAQQNVNIDLLVQAIEDTIPTPRRDPNSNPIMFIARSFDINKPGSSPKQMIGGVLGGALKQGVLKVGQDIEIRPGIGVEERNQKVWKPVLTKISSLKYGGDSVKEVSPGGTFGILTTLDPSIVKSDFLAGNVAGIPEKLPQMWYLLKLDVTLLERVVGVEEDVAVSPIIIGEPLMLNVNSSATVGVVTESKKKMIGCKLKLPVCADVGNKVTISRRVGNRFRLIGYGVIVK